MEAGGTEIVLRDIWDSSKVHAFKNTVTTSVNLPPQSNERSTLKLLLLKPYRTLGGMILVINDLPFWDSR